MRQFLQPTFTINGRQHRRKGGLTGLSEGNGADRDCVKSKLRLSFQRIYQAFWISFNCLAARSSPVAAWFGWMRELFAALVVFFGAASPAAAATTVFASSVFGTTGLVVGAGAAVGPANGAFATILRVGGGSNLILQMSQATTGFGAILTGQRLTAGSNVQIAIGEVISGIATFSTNVALPGGFGPTYSLDLSAACATVSATGCSLLRVRVNGAPGSGFLLDGVSGVAAAPEISIWGMLLLGFAFVAWRLKAQRPVAPALAA